MNPASNTRSGQRITEIANITLLEQDNGKRRMMRFYASRVCLIGNYCHLSPHMRTPRARVMSVSIGDYKKYDASDLQLAFWFADEDISCLLLRMAIFLKPILLTLATTLGEKHASQIPYLLATQSARVINDTYNSLLFNAGSPIKPTLFLTCMC